MGVKRMKRDYEAFLDGYKPALLIESDAKMFPKLIDENFPSVIAYRRKDFDLYLFFQSEENKKKYLALNRGYEEDTYENHYLMGITLGFPKKSVEFFAELNSGRLSPKEEQERKKYKVGVRWAGFSFSTHLDLIVSEIGWLWTQYVHPKSINHPLYVWDYDEDYIEVPYDNFHQLREVCDDIRNKRGVGSIHTKIKSM